MIFFLMQGKILFATSDLMNMIIMINLLAPLYPTALRSVINGLQSYIHTHIKTTQTNQCSITSNFSQRVFPQYLFIKRITLNKDRHIQKKKSYIKFHIKIQSIRPATKTTTICQPFPTAFSSSTTPSSSSQLSSLKTSNP